MRLENASEQTGHSHHGNYRYGNNPVFEVGRYWVQNSIVHASSLLLERPEPVSQAAFEANLDNIGRTLAVLKGPEVNGQPVAVEVAVAGNKASTNNGYDGHFATGSSSIRNNKRQAAEHALRSAADPSRPNVYVAGPGQGGSSYWTKEESRYIRQTGRFTQPDGRPLPTMAAYYRALRAGGIVINRLSTDADGGTFGAAFGVAMEEGDLTHAHFNNLPIGGKAGILGAIAAEGVNQFDDQITARLSRDPARLIMEMFQAAQLYLPSFTGDAAGKQITLAQKARTSHTPDKLLTVSAGLARGTTPSKSSFSPAVHDTAYLLERHRNAKLTFQFPARAASPEEVSKFLEALHHRGRITTGSDNGVEALTMPGTRRSHVAYPTLRQTIREYAYSR